MVADNLEAEAFVEPSCCDAGDAGVQINDRRTELRRSGARRLDQCPPDAVGSVGSRYDQRVDGRDECCPLKVPSRVHGEEPDNVIVLLRDEDLRAWFRSSSRQAVTQLGW